MFDYDVLNDNLSETFGEVIWKYNIDELIDKLLGSLNGLTNRDDLSVKTTDLSNELLETLKTIKNCTNCKDNAGKCNLDEFHESIEEMENFLANLGKEEQEEKNSITDELNDELFGINNELNKELLCEGCEEKEIKKLTDKCRNKEIARLIYECKLNADRYYYDNIQWIPFDEFENIEYLAKGGFGEVHKATWINGYYNEYKEKYEDEEVVLKRIYHSSDKISDILKEVKVHY